MGMAVKDTADNLLESEVTATHTARNEPIHILFLIDTLCESGGAERMLLNMIRLLPKSRFRCSVATFRIDTRVPIFADLPCPLEVLPLRKTYDWSAVKVAWRLRNFIRAEKVSIVHTFFETSDLWGGLIAKSAGNPILVSSRRDMGILRSTKHKLAYKPMGRLFDLVLTVSEQVRHFCIQEDGVDPVKVVTLHNGIEREKLNTSEDRQQLRVAAGLEGASGVVTTLGHIRKVKGIDIFLRAAAIVRSQFPNAMFLVAGDISEAQHFKELEELVESLDLTTNVRFLGNQENVAGLFKMSDVFCLLSRSEGFSNALVEAMAAGLPCVATRVGGNAEAVLDRESGYLVENEDVTNAAECIVRLLRNPELGRRMGQAGRRIVDEKFTAEVMIRTLVRIYDGLLNARRQYIRTNG